MPLSTKTKTSLITPDFRNQIANNMKADPAAETVKIVEEQKIPQSAPVSESIEKSVISEPKETKSKYSDVANLHFTKGKKAEFRAFFSSHEVTLVQGVETAVNYIMKEVKAGNLKISRNGIEKTGEE